MPGLAMWTTEKWLPGLKYACRKFISLVNDLETTSFKDDPRTFQSCVFTNDAINTTRYMDLWRWIPFSSLRLQKHDSVQLALSGKKFPHQPYH